MAKTDTCAFCGDTGTNFKPEHWVSQWISRATVGKNQRVLHNIPNREPWVGSIVDLTVERVCPDCNHGWMSDLETRSRNLVLPLIEGKRMSFEKDQQRTLATWCFLKLITLELGRSEDQQATYPPPVYQGFFVHKCPPTGSLLSLGFRPMPEKPPMFVWWASQAGQQTEPGLGPLPTYHTTLLIGHLVMDVIGVLHPFVEVHTDPDDRLVQIWPGRSETVDWPPPARFKGVFNNELT